MTEIKTTNCPHCNEFIDSIQELYKPEKPAKKIIVCLYCTGLAIYENGELKKLTPIESIAASNNKMVQIAINTINEAKKESEAGK